MGIRNFFQKIKRMSDDVSGSEQEAATITSVGHISSLVNTNTGVNIHRLIMHQQHTADVIQLAFEKHLTWKRQCFSKVPCSPQTCATLLKVVKPSHPPHTNTCLRCTPTVVIITYLSSVQKVTLLHVLLWLELPLLAWVLAPVCSWTLVLVFPIEVKLYGAK